MLIIALLFVRLLQLFSYSIDLDGAEFTFVHYIQQLLNGQPLYMNPEAHPYSAVIYAPLNLYMVYGICKLFSVDQIQDIHTIFIVGRVVSFVSVLCCLFCVDKFIIKHTSDYPIRAKCLLVFLLIMTGHAYAFRPDSMKILFFLWFLYYFIEYVYYTQKITHLCLSILFANLSFLSKQDILFYVLLFEMVVIIYHRNLKTITAFVATIASFGITVFLLRLLFGKYTWISLFLFNLQQISNAEWSYNMIVVVFNTARLLPIYCFLIYYLYSVRNDKHEIFKKVIITSGLLSCVASTFFLFRPGSYLNYTYEAISLLMFGLLLVVLQQQYSSTKRKMILVYFILFFVTALYKNYVISFEKEKNYAKDFKAYYEMRNQILPFVNHNETLFVPDLKLSVFLADKNIVYGHEYHLGRLIYANFKLQSTSQLKTISSKVYDDNFVNGKIDYLLAINKPTEIEVIETYYPKYILQQKLNNFLLYKFKQ